MAKKDSSATFFKEQFSIAQDSFKKLDRRFWWILLFEFLVIVVMILAYQGWLLSASTLNSNMDRLFANVKASGTTSAVTDPSSLDMQLVANNLVKLQGQDKIAQSILYRLLAYAAAAVLAGGAVIVLLKSLIYCKSFHKKWTLRLYGKFCLMTLIWAPLAYIIFIILQRPVFIFLAEKLLTSRAAQAWFIFDLSLILLFLFFITVGLFGALLSQEKIWPALKLYWKKLLSRFWLGLPAVFIALAVFMIINLVLFIFRWFPGKYTFVVLATIPISLYFVWTRLYFARVVSDILEIKEQATATKATKKQTRAGTGKKKRIKQND
ncbi:hypothetical protein HZB03_00905 [Candidatus Woesearchaeota archaeon]|nr:hypothetical protein [Candidatus Woesearchaeota archaeon]